MDGGSPLEVDGETDHRGITHLSIEQLSTVGVSFYKVKFLTGGGILAEWLACVLEA